MYEKQLTEEKNSYTKLYIFYLAIHSDNIFFYLLISISGFIFKNHLSLKLFMNLIYALI